MVATGRIALASATTTALALRTSSAAVTGVMSAATGLFRTCLALDDWTHFLDLARTWPTRRGTQRITRAPQVITATDVCFTYPGNDRPALDHVTLTVRQGQLVALIGENGSGKTTLAKLLTGLFPADSGHVTWDAHDLADTDLDSALDHLALVPQDYTRWPLSARENITQGLHQPGGDATVQAAAEAAGADTTIASLPHGLDTSLARSWWGGHDLSGGHWQRLAVARGFYRDAPVLVLDEPTAAMDARAEHLVFTRLRALSAGRTTICTTHRLANARLADLIIVLERGRLVQQGTWDELAHSPGPFHELLKLQEDDVA
jgi:ATP-binding cassette subfamily B protein